MNDKKLSDEECLRDMRHIQDTLYVISGKWKLPIIMSINNGNNRFREISRSIPKITLRMLSKELKELEINKLITRTVSEDSSILITYKLTAYSQTLAPLIEEMKNWGRNHKAMITEKKT
ncbi:winged helix-turn-helix transcriptional regulator [Pedobacter jejuensis]|uniref:Transcriptional regulator n=1 Tax=Pedobacter jejuensis TaxID=1268550 RepID=A0A3N0BW66_9SPHI|nr:helix-turn-helix domain-containing protein [Pedobacter jejuensis]RNL53946.1 transcriptional regulator [Pedobacter jejuensis]